MTEFHCGRCGLSKDRDEVGGMKGKALICLSCTDLEEQDKLRIEKKGYNKRRKSDGQLS